MFWYSEALSFWCQWWDSWRMCTHTHSLTHTKSTWLEVLHNSVAKSHYHSVTHQPSLSCSTHQPTQTHTHTSAVGEGTGDVIWQSSDLCLPHANVCGPNQVIYQTCVLYTKHSREQGTSHTLIHMHHSPKRTWYQSLHWHSYTVTYSPTIKLYVRLTTDSVGQRLRGMWQYPREIYSGLKHIARDQH